MKILIFLLISYCSFAQNTATLRYTNLSKLSSLDSLTSYRETTYEKVDFKRVKSGDSCLVKSGMIKFRSFLVPCTVTLFNFKKEFVMGFTTTIGEDYGLFINPWDVLVVKAIQNKKSLKNQSIFP